MRQSASFDGRSSYAIVNDTLILGQTNWTWSAWLYSPPGRTENTLVESLYQEGTQAYPCFGIVIFPNEMLHIGAWNIGLTNNWMNADFSYGLTNGWSQLALTLANGGVGSGTFNIFFNGILTNTGVLQRVDPGDTSPRFGVIGNGWNIGQNGYTIAPWQGSMADLRFYNRALSANEVAQLYAIESTPPACIPYAATANAIVTNGFVIDATVTDGGCGYTNTPTVRIIGGGGSGAEAVAVETNGVVIAVTVTNAGSGYTYSPVVVIAPPLIPQPTMGIVSLPVIGGSTAQIMQLGFGNLSPYDNYQLQFTATAGGVWTDFDRQH